MIFKWLHNRKYLDTPICPCKRRMVPVENQFHDTWKCIWKKCDWEVFSGDGGKLHWYKKN